MSEGLFEITGEKGSIPQGKGGPRVFRPRVLPDLRKGLTVKGGYLKQRQGILGVRLRQPQKRFKGLLP